MSIPSYGNRATNRFAHGDRRYLPANHADKIEHLLLLNRASSPEALRLPGLRLHRLEPKGLLQQCQQWCRWSPLDVDTAPTWAAGPSEGQISAILGAFDRRYREPREPTDFFNRLLAFCSSNSFPAE